MPWMAPKCSLRGICSVQWSVTLRNSEQRKYLSDPSPVTQRWGLLPVDEVGRDRKLMVDMPVHNEKDPLFVNNECVIQSHFDA
jgi:hypothetical protein